jgi:hypothetical protein
VVKPALTIPSEFPPALKFAEIHWYKKLQYQRVGRMDLLMPTLRPARFALVLTSVLGLTGLAGCSLSPFGDDSKPETTAAAPTPPRPADPVATAMASTAADPATPDAAAPAINASTSSTSTADAGQIDIRRYLGPNYCPEMRILNGAELMRKYEKGHEDDANSIIWQASFGKTARECLYDPQGGLTLRIGISGRVIAGPKGAAGAVAVPLKIVVVKFREAVLVTQAYTVDAAVPPAGATTFTQVHEIAVPAPGKDRDYIIYIGFDAGKWDPMKGELEPVIAAAPPPPPIDPFDAPPPPPVKPKKPKEPNVLPTPKDGFVLPR